MRPFEQWKQFFKTSNTLHVTGGAVYCPVRGTDVDVERCLACPALDRFSLSDDSNTSFIECDTAGTGHLTPLGL